MQVAPQPVARAATAAAPAVRAIPAEVVVPLYMERPLVNRVHAAMVEFVHRHPHWRVRFVDDGSTDGTSTLLNTLLAVNSESGRMTLETLSSNVGKADAVAHGVRASQADHIFFMDGDLAYDPELLVVLDRALRDADVVIGSRGLETAERAPGLTRRLMGAAYNATVRAGLGLPYRDTQAGIKGFRRDAAKILFDLRKSAGFGFDAELLFIAKTRGLRVAEVPVKVNAEHSTVGSNVRMLRDPVQMLAGIARVRLNSLAGSYRGGREPKPSGS